ncbi:MAG: hypothetical protein R3D29_05815 [Nitratireductor sp.]
MHNFAFDHAEVRFEDLMLDEDKMLGGVGQGFELTKRWFVEARLQIACHTLGGATRALRLLTNLRMSVFSLAAQPRFPIN